MLYDDVPLALPHRKLTPSLLLSLRHGQTSNIQIFSNVLPVTEGALGSAGDAALQVSAEGPEEVPFEKTAVREFAAPLRLAGTYVVHASLGGVSLTGKLLCPCVARAPHLLRCSLNAMLHAHRVCLSKHASQTAYCMKLHS